jgi:MOSC domain-containing protein YiiM
METLAGKVVAVSISKDKGTSKDNVGTARVVLEWGLEGDAHGGAWHRQISLLAIESIERMRSMLPELKPGDFAENITTQGLPLSSLPIGSRLRVGEEVVLEITQIGKRCHSGCAIFQQVGQCIMPQEGIFARVITEGEISVDDCIEILEAYPQ